MNTPCAYKAAAKAAVKLLPEKKKNKWAAIAQVLRGGRGAQTRETTESTEPLCRQQRHQRNE